MIDDVSDQMFGKFSANMQAALAAEAPVAPEPVAPAPGEGSDPMRTTQALPLPLPTTRRPREEVLDVGALGAGAAQRAAGRLLRSAGFWAAIAALEAVALLALVFSR
jgi:hypothetical protein